MNIGVIKERKTDENRVALQPHQAKLLIERGHQVFVELGAGINSGYEDAEYAQSGAQLSPKQVVLDNSQLILKIKSPLVSEYGDYRSHHTLFTYLHFDENFSPENIRRLAS